jgi:hypothetical protein
MNLKFLSAAALAVLCAAGASAQEAQIKLYGFVRTYAHVDSHEMKALTADLFSYLPLDNDNENATWHFSAITSRLGVDVSGYEYKGVKFGAKIETDFYSGVSGVTGTATLRLRQAYMTLGWDKTTLKVGQAWHPTAADMPDVISLNTGAPFGPFSRTPLAQLDWNLDRDKAWSITAAAIWQQQYTSAGPEGASANYIKYGGIPEIYAGINYKWKTGLVRLGADFLSIKPVQTESERMNALSPFFYAQFKKGLFTAKLKSIYAQAGEHLNLNGGYALTPDGKYAPTRNSSSWLSLSYGKGWQGVIFAGYVKNFGTDEKILSAKYLYFSKNSYSNMNQMFRVTPTVIRNFGKFTAALEYELTSVQYGDAEQWGINPKNALYDLGLHWVTNHRVQLMLKYAF